MEVLQSFRLCFFVQFSIFMLWILFLFLEDCMYVTVEALRFWLWVFRFSQFRAVSMLGFFDSGAI